MSRSLALFIGLLAFAPAVQANLADELLQTSYIADCETVEICRESSGCAAFPAFGSLVLQVQGDTGSLGPEPDDPRPLKVFASVADTVPDPEDLGLRFLVEQPAPDPLTRRFAYVDQTRAGPAGRYFILHCVEHPS